MRKMVLIALASMVWTSTSQASIITFVGQDDGAPTSGPFPLSDAAQTSFETAAAAFGSLNTITYESLAVGFYTPIAAAPGVSITLSAGDFGNGFSGISNTTVGNLYGFNTTPGGSQWLGFPEGSATFTFATPIHSFGTFLTGLQTIFSDTTGLAITFNDGSPELLNPPINVNGGAEYFGFTDTSAFSSVTLTDTSADAWGIDDTTYNGVPSTIPEPSSILLLGGALCLITLKLRKKLA